MEIPFKVIVDHNSVNKIFDYFECFSEIYICSKPEDIPPFDKFNIKDCKKYKLIVFTDIIDNKINEYYMKGRPYGISIAYIYKNLYYIPRLVRLNSDTI